MLVFTRLRALWRVSAFCTLTLATIPGASAQTVEQARALYDASRYAEAKTAFDALRKSSPTDPAPPYYLGRIAVIQFDDQEAIRQLERAVQLDSTNAVYHAWLGNSLCDMAIHGSKFKAPFVARRVLKEWKQAVDLDPNLSDTRLSLIRFYVGAPGFLGGDVNKARENAAAMLRRSPMYAGIARGVIAEREKNAAAEEAAYQQAVTAAPDSLLGYVFLAESYTRTSRPADAVATIERYTARRPEDKWGLFQIGRMASGTGIKLDEGRAALLKFLASPPPDAKPFDIAEARYRLSRIADKQGDREVAQQQLSTARQIHPRVESYHELRSLTCR